ncbi:deoxyribodipyrimidine photo-lyase [Massilia sp. R2A-15]|uniref:cryptochrome/photolyase family protein n=1 Tax=Massilia sp. R2A-15 TaxID=3064278 RepID=UPI002734CDFE|nr:deoxyribodipyrimidine photo-lyase [Massilia sp. R2A-15]WLI88391.1 deoxyribodipyrimidine photo-lyase [Massilia sp. R2A-15]
MKFHKSMVWFRRDLRAFDHAALHQALISSNLVYCAFIYDKAILDPLPRHDRRFSFIHASLAELEAELRQLGGHLIVRHAIAQDEIVRLAAELGVDAVFANGDYEPQAIARDAAVAAALAADGRQFCSFKDQVIFEKDEVLTLAGQPYSVFTPYKNAWLKRMAAEPLCLAPWPVEPHAARLAPGESALPTLSDIGFAQADLAAAGMQPGMSGAAAQFEGFIARIADYGEARNYPAVNGTSGLSVHLRFGTTSIRHLVRTVNQVMASGAGGAGAPVWLSELIWREFYAMILFRYPHVVERAFKPAFDAIEWESGPGAEEAFAAWCEGRTGYPLVDAAMAQINRTGFMHNRLRMVAASFLVKDLGIDWRWGERYFALHLNDYELASNNGGWQWAASSGCDAQPWFRIFNPVTQSEKFDRRGEFIRHWLPQLKDLDDKEIHLPGAHVPAIVDHAEARAKTLERYAVVKKMGSGPQDQTPTS